MRRAGVRGGCAAGLFALALAAAVQAAPALDNRPDALLEARVQALAAELRCLVCQNQSLADSHADLAVDLKNQVREQLRAGRSEAEVTAFMTERYGDFVLYRPPLKATTLLLWAGPGLLVLVGMTLLWRGLRRQARAVVPQEPTLDEQQRAAELLAVGACSRRAPADAG